MGIIRVRNGLYCNITKRKRTYHGMNMQFIYSFPGTLVSILQKNIVKIFYF